MPLAITCPSCRTTLDLDEEYRDWTVRCPDCRHEFVPVVPPQAVEVAPPAALARDPAADCNAAGVGLTAVAVLQICVCAFVVFFNAAVRPNLPQPIKANPDEEEAETIASVVIGVCGLFQAGVMILGAVSLRQRRRYALAMAGGIAALFPLNLCCFTALPFGVWTVVLLGRPEVRAAFAAHAEPDDPLE